LHPLLRYLKKTTSFEEIDSEGGYGTKLPGEGKK